MSGSRRSSPTKPANRAVEARERDFWDEHVPSLQQCRREYEQGPDANTRTLLDALEPLVGATVLDFACGAGVVSAWLGARGAAVAGIDVSERSIERATQLAGELGLLIEFLVGGTETVAARTFDRLAGRYALHHADLEAVAPALASVLRPGGRGAFLETMATFPLFPFLRRHMTGRFGIPRLGTDDEHPLTRDDLQTLAAAFGGSVECRVGEPVFLRLFDRQVLRYRSPAASRALNKADDYAVRGLGLESWSYHQVVVVAKPA